MIQVNMNDGMARLTSDPTARVPAPLLRKALPHTLAVDDVEALLEAAGATDAEGWRPQRDRALLEVLYACGARVSEEKFSKIILTLLGLSGLTLIVTNLAG